MLFSFFKVYIVPPPFFIFVFCFRIASDLYFEGNTVFDQIINMSQTLSDCKLDKSTSCRCCERWATTAAKVPALLIAFGRVALPQLFEGVEECFQNHISVRSTLQFFFFQSSRGKRDMRVFPYFQWPQCDNLRAVMAVLCVLFSAHEHTFGGGSVGCCCCCCCWPRKSDFQEPGGGGGTGFHWNWKMGGFINHPTRLRMRCIRG